MVKLLNLKKIQTCLLFMLTMGFVAEAVVIPQVEELRTYCINGVEKDGGELTKNVIRHLLRAKLYTSAMTMGSVGICKPSGFYIESTESAVTYLRQQGYSIHLRPEPYHWEPPSQNLKVKALAEANEIMVKFAAAALISKDEKTLQEFKDQFWTQFLLWEIKEVRDGDKTFQYRNLLWEHDLAVGLRREFDNIYQSRKRYLHIKYMNFEEMVETARFRLGSMAGLSLKALAELREAMPHLRNIVDENEDRATYMMSLTPEGRRLTQEIKVAEDLMIYSFGDLASTDEFNQDTYEVFAQTLIATLNYLEVHVDDFVIADAINRCTSLWRWIDKRGSHVPAGDSRFGAQFILAIQKLASYPALDPYPRLIFHALLANQVQGESRPPNGEDILSYRELWSNMPMGSAYNIPSIKLPMQAYGPLTFSHGPKWRDVLDGLRYIDKWFERHGLKTQDWHDRSGMALDGLLETLMQRRAAHLEQKGLSLCENLLSTLKKPN